MTVSRQSSTNPAPPVLVVGAGVGGLATAIGLAARGVPVQVLERGERPGGKLRTEPSAAGPVDAGPTVFTMRPVFEALFEAAGARLEEALTLRPLACLARHAWADGSRLDLLADLPASVAAIAAFAGRAEAQRYQAFCDRSAAIAQVLAQPFLRSPRPATPLALFARTPWRDWPALARISPFDTLWRALGRQFEDPRLRQLFGRYATYCGASPYAAPATLMLVAHVEREGVWQVRGGLRALADALATLARRLGVTLRCEAEVTEVLVQGGRACGVRLSHGETVAGSAVVFNGDVAALAAGLLGGAARRAVPPQPAARRSLSALTWTGSVRCEGFPLAHHNVFFSDDYAAEFGALFGARRLPAAPTVYLCAQDRAEGEPAPAGAERVLCLSNAPAVGDRSGALTDEEIARCEQASFQQLARCGLTMTSGAWTRTTPADFARRFPGTGGALYGAASHGWLASFRRPGARSRLPGLYLAGGSTHPGPGVPMAALSGMQAAASVLADLASTPRWHPVATSGGTSTP